MLFLLVKPNIFRGITMDHRSQGAHLGGLTRAVDLRKGLQGVKVGVLQALGESKKKTCLVPKALLWKYMGLYVSMYVCVCLNVFYILQRKIISYTRHKYASKYEYIYIHINVNIFFLATTIYLINTCNKFM